jgi:hypothetical protein
LNICIFSSIIPKHSKFKGEKMKKYIIIIICAIATLALIASSAILLMYLPKGETTSEPTLAPTSSVPSSDIVSSVVEDSQSNQSNQSDLSNPANQSGSSSNPDESSVSSKEEVSSKVPSSNIDSSSAPSSSIDSSSATPPVEKPYLKITQPKNQKFSTKSSSVTFKGSTNIATGVTINGNPIKMPRSIDGAFTVTEKLKYGNNKFVFKAGDITKTYNIYRQYTVIKDYSHKNGKSYNSGVTFTVTVIARAKATVKATFNGKTITLKTASTTKNNDFVEFKGKFTLPTKNTKNLNVGKVKYTATYTDFTDTFTAVILPVLRTKRLFLPIHR